jgi:Bacterial Ig-like domain
MSTTHQRQPTAVAAPTAQGPAATPNQYHLAGCGISVSYFPDGFGPIPEDGPDRLFYQDATRHLVFNGSEIRKVDVADLGTILSVTIVRTIDVGSTSFSLILPHVNLPQVPHASATIDTQAITTVHRAFATLIGHPQVETYTTVHLTGTASNGILPRVSTPRPETVQDGVALLADPTVVAPGGSLEVTVDNGGDQTVTYGLVYTIERWDGTAWQKTDIAPTIFPEILLITPPGKGQPQSIQLPANIEPGIYRVAKSVVEEGTDKLLELYAQFEVR